MKAIRLTAEATKQLGRLSRDMHELVVKKVKLYAETPAALANQVKRLRGEGKRMRLRVADYRILFTETATTITVHAIAHRREIYR